MIGGTDIFGSPWPLPTVSEIDPCACASGGRHARSHRSMQAPWRDDGAQRTCGGSARRSASLQLRHVQRFEAGSRENQRVQHVELRQGVVVRRGRLPYNSRHKRITGGMCRSPRRVFMPWSNQGGGPWGSGGRKGPWGSGPQSSGTDTARSRGVAARAARTSSASVFRAAIRRYAALPWSSLGGRSCWAAFRLLPCRAG